MGLYANSTAKPRDVMAPLVWRNIRCQHFDFARVTFIGLANSALPPACREQKFPRGRDLIGWPGSTIRVVERVKPAIHGLVLPQCFQGYRQRTQYGLPTRRLPGTSGSRTGTLAGGGCLRQSPRHVKVRCLSCQHDGPLSRDALFRFSLSPDSPIAAFVKRLRCTNARAQIVPEILALPRIKILKMKLTRCFRRS